MRSPTDKACAFVAPMAPLTGISTKVVQSLWHGLPVIATVAATQGLVLEDHHVQNRESESESALPLPLPPVVAQDVSVVERQGKAMYDAITREYGKYALKGAASQQVHQHQPRSKSREYEYARSTFTEQKLAADISALLARAGVGTV